MVLTSFLFPLILILNYFSQLFFVIFNPIKFSIFHHLVSNNKNNIRDFMREDISHHPEHYNLLSLMVTPFIPRLANQLDLCARSACCCVKCGISPQCYGVASNFECCCCETYFQTGLLCERRDIIDTKSKYVGLSTEQIKNFRKTCCNCFSCCNDNEYDKLYDEHEKQEIEDKSSHWIEEICGFIYSRRRGSCMCDLCEVPLCQCRFTPCCSSFCKAQHTTFCLDNR